jgi:hypothetical protein
VPSHLEVAFPRLNDCRWEIRSPQDGHYNCIAWAADDNTQHWWPNAWSYWPIALRVNTVECFMEAFATLGYKSCKHGRLEIGYQKVAIYADPFLSPKHMARQTFFGAWVSKLGVEWEDIMHQTLSQINCLGPLPIAYYGEAVRYMKRSLWTAYRMRHQRKRQGTAP